MGSCGALDQTRCSDVEQTSQECRLVLQQIDGGRHVSGAGRIGEVREPWQGKGPRLLQALQKFALFVRGAGAFIITVVPDADKGHVLACYILRLAQERLLGAGALVVGGPQPTGKVRSGLWIKQAE